MDDCVASAAKDDVVSWYLGEEVSLTFKTEKVLKVTI